MTLERIIVILIPNFVDGKMKFPDSKCCRIYSDEERETGRRQGRRNLVPCHLPRMTCGNTSLAWQRQVELRQPHRCFYNGD